MQKKLYTYTTCLILLAILREEVFAEEILAENIFAEFKFTILHQHSKTFFCNYYKSMLLKSKFTHYKIKPTC